MRRIAFALAVGCALGMALGASAGAPQGVEPVLEDLKAPSSFAGISDRAERSRALFTEAGRVFQNPRCLNCHPGGDSPTQGEDRHLHYPTVMRGPSGTGVVGMQCTTCHQTQNQELARIPGAPSWHLAPLPMAWAGRTLAEICDELKDSKRNGGRSLQAIVEHSGGDPLVGWAWHPGADRRPAPGTQKELGALLAEWVTTGAECPKPASKSKEEAVR